LSGRVTELIREAAPDIVLTGSPIDYHPDHEATSLLVRDACFATSVRGRFLRAWPHTRSLA
jgi:LmbE family N-acetylglucosaminyl deacetylase